MIYSALLRRAYSRLENATRDDIRIEVKHEP